MNASATPVRLSHRHPNRNPGRNLARRNPARSPNDGFARPSARRDPRAAVRLGLRDDLRRCRQALYAYALHAERAGEMGDPDQEIAVAARGQQQAIHCLVLQQLRADYGDRDDVDFDEEAAVAHADEAMSPEWTFETVERLRRRAAQCEAVGDPQAALQLRGLADAEEESPDLFLLLDETPEPNRLGLGEFAC
jgi:hypothetical protein